MAGQGEALQRDVEAIGDFHIQHGERDGNAFPVVNHFIQVTVGPVVIIAAAAVESTLFKHIPAYSFELLLFRGLGLEVALNGFGHAVHCFQVMFNFDFPIVEACNKQGGAEEVDLRFVLIEFLEEGILRGAFMDGGGQPAQLASLNFECFRSFAKEILIETGMRFEPVNFFLGKFIGRF